MARPEKSGTSDRQLMDAAKKKANASKGGRAAHAQGTAHEFTPEEAREAGRRGGLVVSRDRAHMSQIGQEGVAARARLRATQMRIARIEDPEMNGSSEGLTGSAEIPRQNLWPEITGED